MPMADKNKTKILSKNLFPVVGIGASAGGLEAFKKILKAIPDNSGMAYILVQHLHPDHSSALPEILQRETNIPVNEISDNIEVKPDQVYIIPSNKLLVATDGVLQLSPRPPKDQKNMPIDIFFSSLAEVHQSHSIGIVLSGTGADGTLGLKDIKAHGGITFAQDLESAAYDAMPQSAINADVVDFIMAPEKMPQQLLELNHTFNLLPAEGFISPEQVNEEESFRQVLALLRIKKGVDFTYYKQTTIRRRILRRMVVLKIEKIIDYLEYLREKKPEMDFLFQDMLIPVTSFFRDPKTFDDLCKNVFPEMLKEKSPSNPLRIWIAGCSTGEEAYSMGMCLHEYLGDKISTITIQIFATDISPIAIDKARRGMYLPKELHEISEERLHRFFIKQDSHYHLKKIIRDMCVFAAHNFIKDPPFARMDLISCRNVLIYMEPFLQKKAFNTFHYALREKGYLLLGKSETPGNSTELFQQLDKKEKLYVKKSLPGGRFMNVASERREEVLKENDDGLRNNERKKDDFQKNADDILLSKYTPAGVIVNEQLDIVQFRGSTREYLEPATGKASLNILKMAREGLSFELRNAVHKSKASKEPARKENIPIDNAKRLVDIEVIPLLNTMDLHFLILFRDSVTPRLPAHNENIPGKSAKEDEKNIRIVRLEKDLVQAREDMRSITEDQEAVNEELQSANEELLSGSEELQSLNEELETSKEELQSTNEELITVNQELFDRNEQFNQARVYAEAIVTTIHEPILVVNHDFKIMSANKSFYKDFSINEEETIGKILFDLQNNKWNIPGLRSQLLRIQKGDEKFLEWEVTYAFPFSGERTICFNAQPILKGNEENLILLALNDITSRKEKENAEKKSFEDLRKIFENIPQITSTSAADGTLTFFNKFYLEYTGMTLNTALTKGWAPVIDPSSFNEFKKLWSHSIKTGEDFKMELLLKRKSDNMYRWHISSATPVRNYDGSITSWIGISIDIHDQKTKEETKDEFISIASHELKTPLTTAKAYIQLLQMNLAKAKNKDLVLAQKACVAIDRLNELIGELLDVSKIQNGNLTLNETTFNFDNLISDAIEAVQFSAPSYKIIHTGVTDTKVKGDKERLQQVVVNLLNNAVKYSPKSKKVFVNVSVDKHEVKVSIKDNGIGIKKENLRKVFDRYYREEERAVHFQGLGIGLFISHEIIECHNGKIWAESELGKGSTFYFTIPI